MLRIGTSGWTYKHWRELFYPPKTPQTKWLPYYARFFDTVEINSTFYQIPNTTTTISWQEKTPPDFRFAVKVSRLITHIHKLVNCAPILDWFFKELAPLRTKTLIFLFQFPPAFCPEKESLLDFLALLPRENKYVFEFRNEACYTGLIPDILADKGISFCIHDYALKATPLLMTANPVYLRLHGYLGGHNGFYPDEVLLEWTRHIEDWLTRGQDVLVYFNNDVQGFAVHNARRLKFFLT